MSIRRVVPDITSDRLDESRDFYTAFLGFEVAMDMGWIVTSRRRTRLPRSVLSKRARPRPDIRALP
jgi:hypothetical protein